MKKQFIYFFSLAFATASIVACGETKSKSSSESPKKTSSEAVDLCRCLTEPGNSTYMQNNGETCDALISSEIGVADWTKVNMSQNPEISDRFDALAERCQ